MYRESPPTVLVVAIAEKVFGLDPTTGKRLWRQTLETSDINASRIATLGERTIVLANALYSLATVTGAIEWKANLPGRLGSGTLLLARGLIFVGSAGEAACFRADDGTLLWHDGFRGEGIRNVSLALGDSVAQADNS